MAQALRRLTRMALPPGSNRTPGGPMGLTPSAQPSEADLEWGAVLRSADELTRAAAANRLLSAGRFPRTKFAAQCLGIPYDVAVAAARSAGIPEFCAPVADTTSAGWTLFQTSAWSGGCTNLRNKDRSRGYGVTLVLPPAPQHWSAYILCAQGSAEKARSLGLRIYEPPSNLAGAGGRLYTWFWGRLCTWCPGVVCTRDSCQRIKIEGRLARNARFGAPTCLLWSLWVLSGFAVSMGEAAKRVVFEGVNVSKLKEVSHEKLVLRLRGVSS